MSPVFSVSEFLRQTNELIATTCVIEGEVSHYSVSQGKWVFFDIKDEQSSLSCFSTTFVARVPLETGMKVRVVGYPKVYEKTGKFSFTVQKLELVGEGSFKKAFVLLKNALEKEGLFRIDRKRSLPVIPERLGVITSRDSAAWGDFRRIINNRFGAVELVVRHVNVQGSEAVADIVQAFEKFTAYNDRLDAIVVIRGGGSSEDLAAFNDEAVVRAIYASRVPVVTGIGHERDETLADYVADVRASTPSNAAEILVPERSEICAHLERDQDGMREALLHELKIRRERMEQMFLSLSLGRKKIAVPLEQLMNRFAYVPKKILSRFEECRQFVRQSETLLLNLNPRRLLQRGYSIVRKQGLVVRSKNKLSSGDRISLELADGTVEGFIS